MLVKGENPYSFSSEEMVTFKPKLLASSISVLFDPVLVGYRQRRFTFDFSRRRPEKGRKERWAFKKV